MAELQAQLDHLRQLVEAQKVECPGCFAAGCPNWIGASGHIRIAGQPTWHDPLLHGCKGTGRVPNPLFAGLLEVLRKKCPGEDCKNGLLVEDDLPFGRKGDKHEFCHGTGFVPRNWKDRTKYPDGSYRGALLVGANKAGLRLGRTGYMIEARIMFDMTDEDADQVVIEAIKRKAKEGPCPRK